MAEYDDDINALLHFLDANSIVAADRFPEAIRYYRALTALVAERNELLKENVALRDRLKAKQDEVLDRVFEMDALKQRVAVLESQEFTLPGDPFRDPDRDLRERLVCAIWPEILRIFERADTTHNNGANWDLVRINARDRALTEADAMIAEMRKGDSDAK